MSSINWGNMYVHRGCTCQMCVSMIRGQNTATDTLTKSQSDHEIKQLFAELCPEEFMDIALVLKMGADKYPNREDGLPNWLHTDGSTMGNKDNCDHIFHHLSQIAASNNIDKDSGLHHHLMVACRALMKYTLLKRGIVHEKDL